MASNNWEKRICETYGPNFRIDAGNPSMGSDGSDIYALYGTSDENDISLVGMTQGGTYKLHNDRTIEMIAGAKAESTGCDITITGMNGDVNITAMQNGMVKIKGKNIMVEALEDVDLKAGRNINLTAGSGRIVLKANKIDRDTFSGNLSGVLSFAARAYAPTPLGTDFITESFGVGNFIAGILGL